MCLGLAAGYINTTTKEHLQQEKAELYKKIKTIDSQIKQIETEELRAAYGENFGCEFCRYNAVHGFSGDGWHNTCGADNCTCCHSSCEKYKPDNEITLFIKQNINPGGGLLRCKHTNGYGHISDEESNALNELGINIFRIENSTKAQAAISVLKLLYCTKGGSINVQTD